MPQAVPDIRELLVGLMAWLALAAATALPVAGLWGLYLRGKSLLPPRRTRLVPWTGFEIFLILLLNEILIPKLVYEGLNRIHFFAWVYQTDLTPNGDRLVNARLGIWLMLFSFPLQFITLLAVLRILSSTRSYQVGLTTAHGRRNVVLGWLGWLVLTPAVLFINYVVVYGCTFWLKEPVQMHPIMLLVDKQPLPLEWLLVLFSALVAAPVMEELFYRGVLQPWFASRPWGGSAAMIASFLVALLPWVSRISEERAVVKGKPALVMDTRPVKSTDNASSKTAEEEKGSVRRQPLLVVADLEPPLFVLLLVPCYVAAPHLGRRWIPEAAAARAVFGTALLFAMRHANVWPTPIPLFVLALGLGYITYRTRSLVPSILWHSLFNAVNFVQLILV
jgi:membrane protease YdiL (CAAX protease family)